MEQQSGSSSQQPQIIVVKSTKSVGVAILLSFLFGPLGMLYSTIAGGLIMLAVNLFAFIFTAGIGLFLTWPIGIVWAAVAASNQNKRLGV
jgi:hypothetical protein